MANLTYTHPRNYGKDSRHCRVCKTTRGLIRKYHLNMCRRCFRERANDIGFIKMLRGSGGACAPRRSHCGAIAVHLHVMQLVLTILVLLCPLTAAGAAQTPTSSPQRRNWNAQVPLESQVLFGTDGMAHSRGAGRACSDGLSITRSTPQETGMPPDLSEDVHAIRFAPARVDLGRTETCSPYHFYVGVQNRGAISVRLDGADFTHEGFSLGNDVRGIRLDPGDRFNVQIVFLPSEVSPSGVDAHLRLFTTSGLFVLPIRSTEVALNRYGVHSIRGSVPANTPFSQMLHFVNPFDHTIRLTEIFVLDSFVDLAMRNGTEWIGPRWPRASDNDEVDEEVPGEYDPERTYARRADRGVWDMPAGTTSPLMTVSLRFQPPGVYFTYIHVAAGDRRLLLVPVRITVLKPGIHVEPKELDLGILTNQNAEDPLKVFFAVYNAGLNPIELRELKVLDANVGISAQLSGPAVIPPLSRVQQALTVQIRVDEQALPGGGDCFATLLLKTNASITELAQRRLQLYGKVINGHVAFQLNETFMGVIMPLANVFSGTQRARDRDDDDVAEGVRSPESDREEATSRLVSMADGSATTNVMVGTSEFRKLTLWNQFDHPVELQRVWIPSVPASADDQQQEVTVYAFKQSIASVGAAWPQISLQITPSLQVSREFLAPRSYPLMIETNATLHRVHVHVYLGILGVESSSGLQNYSVSGYSDSSRTTSRMCLAVPEDGLVPVATPRIDGGGATTDIRGVQLCRSLLFDLGKVASQRTRTEVVEVTNVNPVPITLKLADLAESDGLNISISADISLATEVAVDITGLSGSNINGTNYASRAAQDWNDLSGLRSSGNKSSGISAGDDFVLQPGYRATFYVEMLVKDALGDFTVPVLTLATTVEIMHLFARFRSVHGTIEPVMSTIVLPPMFPGRTEVVRLQYRNTFAHSVTPLIATMGSSTLQLLSMSNTMRPQQVESVLDLLFSPAADSKCSDALFLADCLLPTSPSTPTTTDQTCEQLSGYGQFVDEHDLAALSRRDAFWNEAHDSKRQSMLEAQVQLQTDIIDDVDAVTITAVIERPVVTAPAAPPTTSGKQNPTEAVEPRKFALTEVLGQNHIFVGVRNPSNVSVQMELAIAEADQALFYLCNEGWGSEGDENTAFKADDDTATLCLAEWRAAVADARAEQGEERLGQVPPFFFQRQVFWVPAGQEAQLGPIYYLPSQVQEVSTTVFVRNDLSHIEPVPLLARSGKGILELSMATVADGCSSSTPCNDVRASSSAILDDEPLKARGIKCDGTLGFELTERDGSTDFSRRVDIQVSNIGPFDLAVRSVYMEEDHDDPWSSTLSSASTSSLSSRNGFLVTSEHLKLASNGITQGEGGSVATVLVPGQTVRLRVAFRSSCFMDSAVNWLTIDTSDGTKHLRLEGSITPDAAFACLRSRAPLFLGRVLHGVWRVTAVIAVSCVLYALYTLVQDTWTLIFPRESRRLRVSEDADSAMYSERGITGAHGSQDEEQKAVSLATQLIHCRLEDMEQASFASTARVITPAVAQLLARRQRGSGSVAHSGVVNATAGSSDDDRKKRGEGDSSENSEVTGANVEEPKAVAHSSESGKASQRNAVSTNPVVGQQETTTKPLPASMAKTAVLKQGGSAISSPKAALSPRNAPSALGGLDDDEDTDLHSHHKDCEVTGSEEDQPDDSNEPHGSVPPFEVALPSKADEPFEAFEALSARWRTEDWPAEPIDRSPSSVLGTFRSDGSWGGALSLGTFGSTIGDLLADKRHEEGGGASSSSRSANQRGSGSFLESNSPEFFLDSTSVFAPAPAPMTAPGKVALTAKKAPPGFSPADATPLEARVAFEQLRGGDSRFIQGDRNSSSLSGDAFGTSSPFASRLSLFSPALPLPSSDPAASSGAGRIGSGRTRLSRAVEDAGGKASS
ncbi:hypothetical protein BBJ28_00013654 [Nothophytophthora sp. Chile5]|nr:hypothetical protein BBJ28_00013654 [Nothophytophthora sp. Chile5]